MNVPRKKRTFCTIELHTVVKYISLSCILIGSIVALIYIWHQRYLLAVIEAFAIFLFLLLYCGCNWERDFLYVPFLVFHTIVGVTGTAVAVWFLAHGLLMMSRGRDTSMDLIAKASVCLIFGLMDLFATRLVYLDYYDLRKWRKTSKMQIMYLNRSPSFNKKLHRYGTRSSIIV